MKGNITLHSERYLSRKNEGGKFTQLSPNPVHHGEKKVVKARHGERENKVSRSGFQISQGWGLSGEKTLKK